jgi:hypothetical protein
MWSPKDNIPELAREARLAAAQVLAQLAVLRGEAGPEDKSRGEGAGQQQPDAVEAAVLALARADLEGE